MRYALQFVNWSIRTCLAILNEGNVILLLGDNMKCEVCLDINVGQGVND